MEREQSEGSDRDSHPSITSEYHVFLSFRGPDARYGIVDILYECMTWAGLRVFKDDEEIRYGEVIAGELKRAIRRSRVYAIVFSGNYASSAWCLKELDMMVDLHGGSNVGKKIILPIFYGADPADVKLQTELYREALDKHKGRHGEEVVKKWEEALKTVGGISGWDCKAIQREGRFVRLIVQDIVVKLRIKDRSLPDHLTGIDDRVSDILNLLDCDSSGVRLVVLHGMGGIGKTTLASAVFNKLLSKFEGSSFISNVRESAMGHGGIANLQNKLSGDILGGHYASSCNFDDGFGEMRQRIRGKRMLLVLDDVDQFSQLEELVGENPKDTLGTGSRVIITTRDKSVCNRFVRPGSDLLHFYEMKKMANIHALQLLSRHAFGTDEPLEDYLCLSKQVVETTDNLPLALVVIGGHLCCQSKESWKYELEKLKNVPLEDVFKILKVSYDGLDWREKEIFLDIACFPKAMRLRYKNYFWKDLNGPRYVDYLWEARGLFPKTGVKVLVNKSFIKIDSFGEFWIHDQLRDMGREIIRSEGDGRPERRAIVWDPKDALKIVLQKQVSEKIIAMTLGNYREALKLSDENFRGLASLLFLDLKGTKLIGDFGNIRESLMWLSWCGCNKKLNSKFFKMRSLVILRIDGIEGGWRGGKKLMMPNLRVLEFKSSDMTTSPDLSRCLNLEIMVFDQCRELKEIHHSVGKLERLAYMKISECQYLRGLPKELCSASALHELFVINCMIEEIPESIGRLESLRKLDLSKNKIRRLPTSICDLTNLLVLDASNNPLDEGIPEEIGRLSALEELDLSCSSIRFLPATVSQLTSLKSLEIYDCGMLDELRGLPTSLTVLDATGCPLDRGILNKIGSLSALERLDLSRSKIRFLPETFSQLTSLKTLRLNCCEMLQEVRGLPTSLTYFEFSWNMEGLNEAVEIDYLGGSSKREITFSGAFELGFLSRLKTLGWSFPGMGSLETHVEIREFTLTEMKLGGLDSLPSLTKLSIDAAPSLLLVSNIGRLRGLRSLKFAWCGSSVEIPGLEQLEMLEELIFQWCGEIFGIQDLLGLKRLKKVSIGACTSFCRVPCLIGECYLSISNCFVVRDFKGFYSEWREQQNSIGRYDSGEESDDFGEFEGSYSEYEGESSKIQMEDDSEEGGGEKRRRIV